MLCLHFSYRQTYLDLIIWLVNGREEANKGRKFSSSSCVVLPRKKPDGKVMSALTLTVVIMIFAIISSFSVVIYWCSILIGTLYDTHVYVHRLYM